MFFANLGFRWTVGSDIERLSGAVLLPSGNHRERLMRRLPEFRRLLFDPQLYLIALNAEECTKTCARLATYPWFGVEITSFDSDAGGLREWEASVRDKVRGSWRGKPGDGDEVGDGCLSAIRFQIEIGCSHVILPAPLITEREDEAETQARWLDAGIAAAESADAGQPLLATVAVSETALNDAAFESGGFLDTVVDQLSSREGVDGVYIVVVQTHSGYPFDSPSKVQRCYLELTRRFADVGIGQILTNFTDVFGLVCMGVGATGFATGESQKLRRLSLECFKDEGGGKALPHYYAHRICGEFLSETDIASIRAARMLGRLRDVTPFSEPLLTALDAGRTAASVPAWAESQNNVAAAHKHFIQRVAFEARGLGRMSASERVEYVRNWLTDAVATRLLLEKRLAADDVPEKIAPTDEWLDLFDGIVGEE